MTAITETKFDDVIPRAGRGGAVAVLRIQPSKGWVSLKLGELWEYRELLYFLVWRDIKVRYKQTALGAAWAIIQPFFTMVVFSLFFGKLAKMPSDGMPYPIFCYAALVPVELLRERPEPVVQQPGRQRQPDQEGLFPAAGDPDRDGPVRRGRLRCSPSSVLLVMMAVLRHHADRQRRLAAAVPPAGAGHGAGRGPLAVGAERPVPRRALRGAVPHAVLDVRDARSPIRAACSARAVADRVRSEPDGRRGRGLPLGAARAPTPLPGR